MRVALAGPLGPPPTANAIALEAYYDAWYTAVHAAGFVPGLCVGATEVLGDAALGGLAFSHYWQAQGATATPAPRGYQLVQGDAATVCGVSGWVDTTQDDAGYGGAGSNQVEWLVADPR